MLTGRPPFQGDNAVSVLRAITSDRCPPIRQVQPGLPEEAERIVNRALEKESGAPLRHRGRDGARYFDRCWKR